MNRKIKLLTALTMSSMMLFSSVPVYASETVSIQDDENTKEMSPKIEDVNIDNFASEGNTTRAYVKALGKNITYKFEILAEEINKDGTSNNKAQNYTLLKEGLTTNYIEWNNNDIKNIEGKTEEELQKEGKILIYKLKVTVSNEFGEDSSVATYDPNYIPMRPESLYLISATIGNNVYNINDKSIEYNCKVSDEVNINPTGFIYEGDKINYYVNDEKVESSDINYTFKPTKAGTYTIKLEGISANENESKEKYGIDNAMTIKVNVTNNLKVAVDNKVLDDDQHEIKCNTNQKLYFVGETDYINYNLYVNDKLVDSRERNNELYYAFENKGIYSVKIEGISDDGIKATKEFNVVVEDISKDAPKIESINYSNFVGELNNINVDVVCKGNDVKYTYEFLREYDVMNMCTGYWCTDFNNYDMILDSSDKNGVEFTSPIDENNNPIENGTVYRYKLKVTAKNDNGYDVHVINLDLNKNIANKKEEFKHENNYLDVAVNNKVLGSDIDVINCNTNQNMYFVGEKGSISYFLYINDKLVDKKTRNNEFNYIFTTPGEYNVKIAANESNDEDEASSNKDNLKSRSFKVVVKDKDKEAPKIKSINYSNKVGELNNINVNVDCKGNDVKYTYEFLREYDVCNMETGYWCANFNNYDMILDSSDKSEVEFTSPIDENNNPIENGTVYRYKLKVTAKNDNGYDVRVINLDLNEDQYKGEAYYLDVAVNNRVLDYNEDVINCNTNQKMYLVGETGSISYYLYINDKLVDKKFRNNEFNYTFTTPGEYNVKIVTDESCNGCNEDGVPSNKDDLNSRSFKVVVKDKDEKAPTIKEVKISNSVTDKNNVDLSVDCTGDNVKYTYEFLKKVVNNAPTGYWCKDFISFDVLSDNDSKNNLTFTVDKFNKEDYLIEKDPSFECDCYYTLKITATNEYGYDVQEFKIDLNEDYEGKKINFIERIEYNDDENKDEDNKENDTDINKNDENNKDQDKEIAKEEDNKDQDKEIVKEEDNKDENKETTKEEDNKSDISQDANKNLEDAKNDGNKVNTRDNSHLGIITGLLGISLFSILRKKNK